MPLETMVKTMRQPRLLLAENLSMREMDLLMKPALLPFLTTLLPFSERHPFQLSSKFQFFTKKELWQSMIQLLTSRETSQLRETSSTSVPSQVPPLSTLSAALIAVVCQSLPRRLLTRSQPSRPPTSTIAEAMSGLEKTHQAPPSCSRTS